jgi:RNA polymerase sigma-70 factor, ECF subfamily
LSSSCIIFVLERNKLLVLDQEQKMVEAAKRDPQNFGALYDKYFAQIYRYVARRVNDKDTAHDIVSQTFFDALSHIESFEWRGFSFSAWLYKIAHNNVLKWYREQSKATLVTLDEGRNIADKEEHPIKNLIRNESKGEVTKVLNKLDLEEREIIRLKFFEEVSNVEIAEIMGLSANHIGVKVFRVLKKVKLLISTK